MAPYTPIVLKEDASLTDITFVEANRSDLWELEIVRMYKRRYPRNYLGSHLFGHVGQPTAAELNQPGNDPDDMIGKMGLERYYNNLLMGINGKRRVIVDSRGKQVELLGFAPTYDVSRGLHETCAILALSSSWRVPLPVVPAY